MYDEMHEWRCVGAFTILLTHWSLKYAYSLKVIPAPSMTETSFFLSTSVGGLNTSTCLRSLVGRPPEMGGAGGAAGGVVSIVEEELFSSDIACRKTRSESPYTVRMSTTGRSIMRCCHHSPSVGDGKIQNLFWICSACHAVYLLRYTIIYYTNIH